MNSTLKAALVKIEAEEKRLVKEAKEIAVRLSKVRAVKKALKMAEGISVKAAEGTLEEAVVAVLRKSRRLMTNSELRDHLAGNGYAYSLEPMRMTKALIKLTRSGKHVIRVGEGRTAAYKSK